LAKGKDPKDADVEDESESGNTPDPEDPTDPACEDCTITPLPWANIDADNDSSTPINGYEGGKYPTVLENDKVNSRKVNPSEVILTPGTSPLPDKIRMNPDGSITIDPQTPAGTYRYPYTICEVRNPDNCDDAVATIVVTPALIEAENDEPEPINGLNGGETPSVLESDKLNKVKVKPEEVTLTWIDEAPDGLSLNPDGSVTVDPGTPSGMHLIRYRICEVLNPNNCDEA